MNLILRKAILILGVLLIVVGSSQGNALASPIIGPYTQQAHGNSVVVLWTTAVPTRENKVYWGASLALGNVTVEKNMWATTTHSVTINGLTAGVQYFYKVVSNEDPSPLYNFWTAFHQNGTIRFVAYGDSRGGWDNWQAASLVAEAIERENPLFVLNTGDLVDNGKTPDDWVDFFTASSFVHNSTLYPVLGNHENYSHLYFSFFSLPFNERWYSFDNGPVHFIGLDSNPRNAYRFVQYLWLLHELGIHNQAFTVVFFHHPVYSSGEEHGNTTLLQKVWAPVFERYHVDIVFNGHDHDYERSYVNGIIYIVTGGGGAPIYDVGHSPWTVYSEKTYHYCMLTVNSSTLTFEAKKPDGFVFDSFILTK
ncbi:MAG: metallophosphoesterase family protein [Euryarchaeota archaeon]|nr:metallophosphoesterase family protein [Euryarchaeota archaeon]